MLSTGLAFVFVVGLCGIVSLWLFGFYRINTRSKATETNAAGPNADSIRTNFDPGDRSFADAINDDSSAKSRAGIPRSPASSVVLRNRSQ